MLLEYYTKDLGETSELKVADGNWSRAVRALNPLYILPFLALALLAHISVMECEAPYLVDRLSCNAKTMSPPILRYFALSGSRPYSQRQQRNS